MNEQMTCAGCGISIQTEENESLGYTPKAALKRDVILCQRCYRLKHYNEVPDVHLSDDDFIRMLQTISNQDALVVKIVDIFDFSGSWVPGIQRFAGKNEVILVGNKVDVLPQSIKLEKLEKWMRYMAKQQGLKPAEVQLISAERGTGIEELAQVMDDYRDGRDVYVVGSTNVGKSTFINKLIQIVGGEDEHGITTSQFPGTTLNFIDIPLDDGRAIYDTPGIINRNQMAHFVEPKDLKVISPQKEIKPKIFQLNDGQTLFFGGLARIDFIKGNFCSFVCYFSNDLYIHRTKTENADELYQNQIGSMLTPPNHQSETTRLKPHQFKIDEENTDIVISGLGWITVKQPGVSVTVHAPEGVGISIRRSIIKG